MYLIPSLSLPLPPLSLPLFTTALLRCAMLTSCLFVGEREGRGRGEGGEREGRGRGEGGSDGGSELGRVE